MKCDKFFKVSYVNEEEHKAQGNRARQALLTVIQRNDAQKLTYTLTLPQTKLATLIRNKSSDT